MSINPLHKAVARHTAGVFGGRPSVRRYYNDDESLSLDILECPDSPLGGMTSLSTLGFCDYPTDFSHDGRPLCPELVITGSGDPATMAQILVSCGLNHIQGRKVEPGMVYTDVLPQYLKNSDMTAVLLLTPFLWEDKLQSTVIEDTLITWLQVLPLSAKEHAFLVEEGLEALEERLEQADIDFTDLNRDCIFKESGK